MCTVMMQLVEQFLFNWPTFLDLGEVSRIPKGKHLESAAADFYRLAIL